MANYNDMMKRAQEMQSKMKDVQNKLNDFQTEGKAGGGLVKIVLSGKGSVSKVSIDPSLLRPEEQEIVEDLLAAAFTDAQNKLNQHMQEEMSKVTGGLPLGGMF